MQLSIPPQAPVGPTTGDLPTLELITGVLDPIWKPVAPGDDDYMRWFGAWNLQHGWDFNNHEWYWSQHLSLWPRKPGAPSHTGLFAPHAGRWLRRGYSKRQIAVALGYARTGDVTVSLWRLAEDYRDFLERKQGAMPPFLQVDGPESAAIVERGYVEGVRVARGEIRPEDAPDNLYILSNRVDPSEADAEERIRRFARMTFRSPRIVSTEEWADGDRFGMPEPFSVALLYSDYDKERLARAVAELEAKQPFHAAA